MHPDPSATRTTRITRITRKQGVDSVSGYDDPELWAGLAQELGRLHSANKELQQVNETLRQKVTEGIRRQAELESRILVALLPTVLLWVGVSIATGRGVLLVGVALSWWWAKFLIVDS